MMAMDGQNDRDSEDPDDEDDQGNDTVYHEANDSELMEDRYRQVDPNLDRKIQQIRQGNADG